MFNGNVVTRYSKLILVWAVALYASLVVFNNLTDYGSNYQFVSHVLQMDTTFPGNAGMWRAINTPILYHIAYIAIILTESVVAILCWVGGYRLYRAIQEAATFNRAKATAVAGLTLGLLLWFAGFIAVGGEWFLMWQSQTWNGIQAAFRLTAILGIVLVYLTLPDGD